MELLKAEKREVTGKKVQSLRDEGKVPGVVYGSQSDNINLSVDYLSFEKLYKKAGESTLINLKVSDAEEIPVLIHEVAYNPVSHKIDHVDFYKIKYGQKLTANVELEFLGEPKAVKELGGILVTSIEEVEIECLPKDLIGKIEVDLTVLKTFDDSIHIRDLKVPEAVKILTGADETVAIVVPPKLEEEAPQAAAAEGEKAEAGKEGAQEKSENKKSE